MSDITVRSAHYDELERIGQISVEAYVADGLLDSDGIYEQYLRDAASRFEQAELLVAVDDGGTLLGSVTVARSGTAFAQVAREGELEFRMLATSLAARGRGIGALLTRAVADRARALGCGRVVLYVVDTNTRAIGLYRKLGFQRLAERDWQPHPSVRLVAFGLDLEPP